MSLPTISASTIPYWTSSLLHRFAVRRVDHQQCQMCDSDHGDAGRVPQYAIRTCHSPPPPRCRCRSEFHCSDETVSHSQSHSETHSHLIQLADVELQLIAQFLDGHSLTKLHHCNRRWHRITSPAFVWRNAMVHIDTGNSAQCEYDPLKRRRHSVLRHAPVHLTLLLLGVEYLTELLRLTPGLQSLELVFSTAMTQCRIGNQEETLRYILTKPEIISMPLEIRDFLVTPTTMQLMLPLRGLHTLEISVLSLGFSNNPAKSYNRTPQQITAEAAHLEADAESALSVLSQLPSLRRLGYAGALSGEKPYLPRPHFMRHIAACEQLESLWLLYVAFEPGGAARFFGAPTLSRLRHLTLQHVQGLDYEIEEQKEMSLASAAAAVAVSSSSHPEMPPAEYGLLPSSSLSSASSWTRTLLSNLVSLHSIRMEECSHTAVMNLLTAMRETKTETERKLPNLAALNLGWQVVDIPNSITTLEAVLLQNPHLTAKLAVHSLNPVYLSQEESVFPAILLTLPRLELVLSLERRAQPCSFALWEEYTCPGTGKFL